MPKPRLNSRVPEETKQEVKDFADQRNLTQSEATRRLLNRGLDYERGILKAQPTFEDAERSSEEPEGDRQDGPSAGGGGGGLLDSLLPSFIAVMFGVAFVLVPSGDIFIGGAALGLASMGAVGSGFAERRRVKPLAAPVVSLGRLIRALLPDSMAPYEPTTSIERVATWDRHALTTFIIGATWMLLAAVAIMLFGAGGIIATLGVPLSLLLLVVVPIGLQVLGAGLQVVATAAALAVTEPTDDPTSTGEVAADE